MHVRCERCSTVYELDERVLPPGGAPVQCSRCKHVFQAWPPQAAGRTQPMFPAFQAPGGSAGAPAAGRPAAGPAVGPGPWAAGAPAAAAPSPAPAVPPPAWPVAGPAPAPGAARAAWPTAGSAPAPPAPRPGAPRQPPTAPRQSASRAPARAPRDPRNDTVTLLARRIRSQRTWKWLGPLLLLLATAAGGGVLWHRSRQIAPEAAARRQEGLRLLARDDARSLEQAAEALADASRLDPKLFQARADRALALTLLAADERDRAARLEASFKALDADRFRLEAEKAEGWQGRQAEVLERMKGVKDRIQPLRERGGRLAGEALADLKALARPHGDDPSVARALAWRDVLDGSGEQASRVIRNARAAGQGDPWLDLAEAALDVVAANAQVTRQRAVSRLAPLAAAHPDLLRARMLLSRAQSDLGQRDAAVAALDGVLEANGSHEAAREMKERLLEPPPAEPVRAVVPQRAPPPGRPGLLPRRPNGGER